MTQTWNITSVAQRFEGCADTLGKLPGGLRLGHASYWPEIRYEPKEFARQSPGNNRLKATPREITEMEETLTWFAWLTTGERQLVWLRAYGVPWRTIAHEIGYPRTSAQRYWEVALQKIVARLEQDQAGKAQICKSFM